MLHVYMSIYTLWAFPSTGRLLFCVSAVHDHLSTGQRCTWVACAELMHWSIAKVPLALPAIVCLGSWLDIEASASIQSVKPHL